MVGAVAQKVSIDIRDLCAITLSNIQDSLVKSVKEFIGLLDVHPGQSQITNSIGRIIDGPEDDEAVGKVFTKGFQDLHQI